MTTLKEVLKAALANKNTQVHRMASDTKRGRQMLAATKDKQDIHSGNNPNNGTRTRDTRGSLKGTIGKRDI